MLLMGIGDFWQLGLRKLTLFKKTHFSGECQRWQRHPTLSLSLLFICSAFPFTFGWFIKKNKSFSNPL